MGGRIVWCNQAGKRSNSSCLVRDCLDKCDSQSEIGKGIDGLNVETKLRVKYQKTMPRPSEKLGCRNPRSELYQGIPCMTIAFDTTTVECVTPGTRIGHGGQRERLLSAPKKVTPWTRSQRPKANIRSHQYLCSASSSQRSRTPKC